MLGTTGDEEARVAQHARHQPTDRAANMALGIDVTILPHGVALATHLAARVRLALDQGADDALDAVGAVVADAAMPRSSRHA